MGQTDTFSFITPFEKEYPDKLKNIPDAPAGLYVRGKVPAESEITVAVVGARDCSEYGRYVAEELGSFLGKSGVTVVSGMARGIDGISQWAALEAGGTSIGILGCGVDICYPARNRALFDRLSEQGTIISEYPPGTPPRPMNFPARNRIVSGLADAVVVIEARCRSGTLITVDMALEQGKEVFVVPGRVTDRLSDGCNRLIKQGAAIMLSPEELLEELRELKEQSREYIAAVVPAKGNKNHKARYEKDKENQQEQKHQKERKQEEQISDLPPELRKVYQALDFYPQSVEQIMEHLSFETSQRQVAVQLIRLCMENKAIQVSPGHFSIVMK